MPSLQRGFTLVELMIVVGIIALLSAIALPRYQDYSIRSKMSEVVLTLSGCRTSVTEVYQAGVATAPGPNGWGCEIGGSTATRYVSSISTNDDGLASATVQNISGSVNGSVITLAPLADATTLAAFTPGSTQKLYGWRCGNNTDGTSVAARYLPGSCRG